MPLGPFPFLIHEIQEGRPVINLFHSPPGPFPHGEECTVSMEWTAFRGSPSSTRHGTYRTLHRSYDVADCKLSRRQREPIAALFPAPRFDKPRLLQLTQNYFQKTQRYRLGPGNIRGPGGTFLVPLCQLENGPDRVLTFLREGQDGYACSLIRSSL